MIFEPSIVRTMGGLKSVIDPNMNKKLIFRKIPLSKVLLVTLRNVVK